VVVDLENKSQEFQDLYSQANPVPGARAKVPLLEVTEGGEKILVTESLVVTEYVAETFGTESTLLPASAKDRAVMRLFMELCGSKFGYFGILRGTESKESFSEGLVAVDAFLKHYGSKPFLFGSGFSLAESNAAPFVQRACTILPAYTGKDGSEKVDPLEICDEKGLKHLKAWMEALLQRPSVVESGVPEETLIERAGQMLQRFQAAEASKPAN